MNEFALIHTYFRPLAAAFPGSLDLRDDAALLTSPPGMQLVVTADALSAGVHFFGTEDASLIARKALRTNISDLAAMGAQPFAYFLCVMLPRDTTEAWIARFAHGLAADQAAFGIHLAGGDTTRTDGPLSIAITALGHVPVGAALTRSGARGGDKIYVSGTLGDAALGLACFKGELPEDAFLQNRYVLPQPRVALGLALRGVASACMDISDGLVQDMGHICAASGVGAMLYADALPLSVAAQNHGEKALHAALSGGDDYELLFTGPPDLRMEGDCAITCIGDVVAGNGVDVVDKSGVRMAVQVAGFTHF